MKHRKPVIATKSANKNLQIVLKITTETGTRTSQKRKTLISTESHQSAPEIR